MMTAAVPPADPVEPPFRMKRRRWYVAALLSLLCPGLGQLYNGQHRRAFAIFAAVALIAIISIPLTYLIAEAFLVFIALGVILVAVIAFYLFVAIDAGLGARRLGEAKLRRYNRVWIYVLILAVSTISNGVERTFLGAASWSIPGGSMIPTLQIGDRVIAQKNYFAVSEARYGELVIFKLPIDGRADYIKRIVGLPGDTIQMIGGRLHINGKAVDRERIEDQVEQRGAMTLRLPRYIETLPGGARYRILEMRGDNGMLDNTPLYRVPKDHYFMLGDNRDNSQDSRILSEIGFIPRANLHDKPAFVYWSQDRSRIGLRVE